SLINPNNNGSNISLNPTIKLKFSEPVKNVDATNITILDNTGTSVAISNIVYDPYENTYTFSPTNQLKEVSTYSIILESNIIDQAEMRLAKTIYSFSTLNTYYKIYANNWRHININWNINKSNVEVQQIYNIVEKPVESSYITHYMFNDINVSYNNGYITIKNNTPRKFSAVNLLFRNTQNNYSIVVHMYVPIAEFTEVNYFYQASESLGTNPEISLLDMNYNFNPGVKSFGTNICTESIGYCKATEFQQKRYKTFQRNFKLVFNRPQITNEIRDFFVSKCNAPNCIELTTVEAKTSYAATNWFNNAMMSKYGTHEAMNIYVAEGVASLGGDWMAIFTGYLSEPLIASSWRYNTYIHELFHNYGYNHSSGMAYGWSDELGRIIANGALPNLDLDYIEDQSAKLISYIESINTQKLMVNVKVITNTENNIQADLTSRQEIPVEYIIKTATGFNIVFKTIPSDDILVNVYSNNAMSSFSIKAKDFYKRELGNDLLSHE
ncbi:MAG: Ig-like domain-containing protein, partial [Burkholderiales bacterium]|nr:Ig-like domain-containing protein [Burkholderiales bacterium]